MRRISIIIAALAVVVSASLSCTDNVDECVEKSVEYRIVNNSGHIVSLCEISIENADTLNNYTIYDGDSLILMTRTRSCGRSTQPFFNYVLPTYDDSITANVYDDYIHNVHNYAIEQNYKYIFSSDTLDIARYVITNDDYQYAVEHRLQ